MKKFSQITASVLAFFLAFAVIISAGADIRAAGKKNFKSVTVRMDSRKVNGKTVSMQRGKSSSLKVSASPNIRKKTVSYKSSKPSRVSVNKKGKLTAKKAGTAKISITVRASGYKAKTVRVNIKVVDNAGTGPSQGADPGTGTGSSQGADTGTGTDPSQGADTGTGTDPSQGADTGIGTDPSQKPSNNTGKALVVYFSCTGTTAGVARTVADAAGADIYEIQAQEPYTSADLNYSNSSSRATREQNDPSARPAIAGSTDISSYDVIYIGYPIWWGVEPRIIDTFLESYNFSGKKIAPFCTSGSSGISGSVSRIRELAAGAEVLQGMRFPSGASRNEVENWLRSLGI